MEWKDVIQTGLYAQSYKTKEIKKVHLLTCFLNTLDTA